MSPDIYPPIEQWLFPEGVWSATLDGVIPLGTQGLESGAFWLGTRSKLARIEAVILPSGLGVYEHPYQWRVSPEVFGVITRWSRAQGLTLLGIAHTHIAGVPVDLSPSDRTRSVQVPGMLAVVIGNGGLDKVFTDWGWFVYETDDYEIIPRVNLLSRIRIAEGNHVQVFKADSSGIVPLNANDS